MTTSTTNIYWSTCIVDNWQMYIAKTDEGLCYIGTPNASFSELETWVNKKIANGTLIKKNEVLQDDIIDVKKYLQGKTTTFSVPIHLIDTDLQKQVWQTLQTVPYGKTKTYTDIATQIGRPKAVRAVGSAIGANPLLMIIPCHRILAKSGGLAGFRAGLD